MSAPLLRLSNELRNQIYDLLLVMGTPISPIPRTLEKQHHLTSSQPLEEQTTYPTQLLYVNRQIHYQASSFFYASNRFNLHGRTAEEVAAFLTRIGPQNSGFLRHIEIDLPDFPVEGWDIVAPNKPNSQHLLPIVRNHCPNLSTLTMRMERFWSLTIKWRAQRSHPNVITDLIELIDSNLRLHPSLREIIAVVFTDGPDDPLVKAMRQQGWTVNATEYEAEVDEDENEDECHWDIYD